VYAVLISNAVAYRFLITNSGLGYSYSFDKLTRSFTLNTIPGLQAGSTYTVRVAVKIGNTFGEFGKSCTITIPVVTSKEIEAPLSVQVSIQEFEAMPVPNPFAIDFKLNVKTASEAPLQVKVYDMLGQLVENKNMTTTEVEAFTVGANYPSGVYNVIVSQGDSTKTLRVIKR
jgi:hypothetical protein